MSWDDLSQAKEDWPSVREAWDYRGKAYKVCLGCEGNQSSRRGGLAQRARGRCVISLCLCSGLQRAGARLHSTSLLIGTHSRLSHSHKHNTHTAHKLGAALCD